MRVLRKFSVFLFLTVWIQLPFQFFPVMAFSAFSPHSHHLTFVSDGGHMDIVLKHDDEDLHCASETSGGLLSSLEERHSHADHIFHGSSYENQLVTVSLKAPESPKASLTVAGLISSTALMELRSLSSCSRSPPPDINPNLVLLRCTVLVI